MTPVCLVLPVTVSRTEMADVISFNVDQRTPATRSSRTPRQDSIYLPSSETRSRIELQNVKSNRQISRKRRTFAAYRCTPSSAYCTGTQTAAGTDRRSTGDHIMQTAPSRSQRQMSPASTESSFAIGGRSSPLLNEFCRSSVQRQMSTARPFRRVDSRFSEQPPVII